MNLFSTQRCTIQINGEQAGELQRFSACSVYAVMALTNGVDELSLSETDAAETEPLNSGVHFLQFIEGLTRQYLI